MFISRMAPPNEKSPSLQHGGSPTPRIFPAHPLTTLQFDTHLRPLKSESGTLPAIADGLDDERAVGVAHQQRLALQVRVAVLGDHALGGEPLLAQLAQVALVGRAQATVAAAALVGRVRHQLLAAEKALGALGTLVVGRAGLADR